ncbi:MAG: FAD binding domain-containing protein, partial [Actinomycetota bacterium]|nr:FAD binding domain-containing protein [Actinomycetota bacterium]
MLLREVSYARATSVDEALALLSRPADARPLAGGQTLINVMKARAASPDVLVDLNGIEDLRTIRRGPDGALEVGAMATYADVMLSSEVAAARPILAEVANVIADVQVRNRGTVGGNVCANDPTNHFPPLFSALRARFTISGRGGERTVSAEEFFQGVFVTAVAEGELLRSVTVPAANGAGDGFASIPIGKDGTGIVNVAASVDGGSARIAIGCVAAVPVVVESAADEESVRAA